MRLAAIALAALLGTVMMTKDANALLGTSMTGPLAGATKNLLKNKTIKKQLRPPVVDHRGPRRTPPLDPRSRPAPRPGVRR